MKEKIYAKGIYYNPRYDNSPDFVEGKLSINIERFNDFINDNYEFINDNGYIRFDILKSKHNDGEYYVVLDTYKKKNKGDDIINLDDLRF